MTAKRVIRGGASGMMAAGRAEAKMWKRSLYLVAFLAIILTVSGCTGGPGEVQARLDEEFPLSVGQRASIMGENLTIRFEEMTEDSRCPREVTCIWAGRVTCMLELTHAGSSYRMALTEPGLTDEYSRERYEGYELTFHVTPYPEAGRKIPTDTYRLHVIVSKLPDLTERLGSVIDYGNFRSSASLSSRASFRNESLASAIISSLGVIPNNLDKSAIWTTICRFNASIFLGCSIVIYPTKRFSHIKTQV